MPCVVLLKTMFGLNWIGSDQTNEPLAYEDLVLINDLDSRVLMLQLFAGGGSWQSKERRRRKASRVWGKVPLAFKHVPIFFMETTCK